MLPLHEWDHIYFDCKGSYFVWFIFLNPFTWEMFSSFSELKNSQELRRILHKIFFFSTSLIYFLCKVSDAVVLYCGFNFGWILLGSLKIIIQKCHMLQLIELEALLKQVAHDSSQRYANYVDCGVCYCVLLFMNV